MRRVHSTLSFDLIIFTAVLALMVIGVFFIYSSGMSSGGQQTSYEYIKQIVWIVTGIGLMFLFYFINYENIGSYIIPIFIGSLLLLIFTLIFGRIVNGARSWLGFMSFGIQPSEFTKITTILALAAYLKNYEKNIKGLKYFIGALAIVGIPMGLILIQPDMGTAMVYVPIFIFMVFMGGADIKHILFILLTGILIIVFTVLPEWQNVIHGEPVPIISILTNTRLFLYVILTLSLIFVLDLIGLFVFKNRYFYWIAYVLSILILSLGFSILGRQFLKEYQMMRLIIFMDPNVDKYGAGWNIIQSVTAVGSGGFSGKGYLQGTQSHYNFLPQQSTDFIFSVLAEEWGFVGCVVVFILFAIILYRGIAIMTYSKDSYGVYCGAGIISMIFFHLVVNVGMVSGIMPITGIPLFFLSYGGSSLWTISIGIGILLSIYKRRYRY